MVLPIGLDANGRLVEIPSGSSLLPLGIDASGCLIEIAAGSTAVRQLGLGDNGYLIELMSTAKRLGTFKDLPADLGLLWYHFPASSTVTIDSNGKIASIENNLDTGSNPAVTARAAGRHAIAKLNGFDTAYSADTNLDGILVTDTSKLPIGNADRHQTWVVVSQDGVVGGYRGGGRQYWVDNPFPDYRLRTNNGDFTGSGNTNNSQLHALSLNHRSGVSFMTVDGTARGAFAVELNTSLGTYGIKGAETSYYTMKGNTLLHYAGKRAATVEEQYKIDSICQQFTGVKLADSHPYAASPWMVPA